MYRGIFCGLFLPLATVAVGQVSNDRGIKVQSCGDTAIVVSGRVAEKWIPVLTIESGRIVGESTDTSHEVAYDMITGKRTHCANRYVEREYALAGGDTITMRVYDDGVAWSGCHDYKVDISQASHSWLMEWIESYEGFFRKDRSDIADGFRVAYPSLFEYGDKDLFMLLTESGIDKSSAASSLYASCAKGRFEIHPDGDEMSGWQTAIIGSLADVVESTLVNDNSVPSRISDTSWIRPGVASWIYWAYNHGSNDYDIICRYVDMAHELKLPYVLIDAEWDEMKNGKTVLDAVNYARDKGVMPMIWYNSSIGWIDGAPGPKFRLNDPEMREKEFAWCEENGIKGVKIDFFSGDTNRNLSYMAELLECAARHKLLVNFHGATIPRGFQRTYPNLMSVEGVYGAEWYNNVPTFTDEAASHNATLPFTRNVIGSMDYTPCAFTDSQHPHITTDAHELALTVLYESGIQHLADRPESFLGQPEAIRRFLSELPVAWDDTMLLGGYLGEYVVMARRKDDRWYIAGINGQDCGVDIRLDLSRLPDAKYQATVITDSDDGWSVTSSSECPESMRLMPRGGFIIMLETV